MDNRYQNTGCSVKVMLSYDYCHFEVCKSYNCEPGETISDLKVDEMRKECQRLADKAVEQYKKAKHIADRQARYKNQLESLTKICERIAKKPESEWTEHEKAQVKALEDKEWFESRINRGFDYEDDFDDSGMDDDYERDEDDDNLPFG